MKRPLAKYFLFLIPYVIASFLMLIAESFFYPESSPDLSGTLYAFPRLKAFAAIAYFVLLLGFYRLAELSRDKLVIAFAGIEFIACYRTDLLEIIFGYNIQIGFAALEILLVIAEIAVCAWMLIRINRIKKIAIPVILLAVALSVPDLISRMSDYTTPFTAFLSGEFFSRLREYVGTLILPLGVFGFYLRYYVTKNLPDNQRAPDASEI